MRRSDSLYFYFIDNVFRFPLSKSLWLWKKMNLLATS